MGFYGNVTTTAKTQFSFDKTYANKYEMEKRCSSDGVYIGRYVLVEYDTCGEFDTSVTATTTEDGKTNLYPKKVSGLTDSMAFDTTTSDEETTVSYYFYNSSGEVSTIEYTDDGDIETVATNYNRNYAIDKKYYNISKGYDSTVWQKVKADGTVKYVMIAELNAATPTFTLVPEAPDDTNKAPYFGEYGSSQQYSLHIQPPWGLKLGTVEFNEAGFDENTHASQVSGANEITVTKSKSGTKYGTSESQEDDTKNINISLPGIGNMMSKAWDIIHGTNRDDGPDSLQGKLNEFTELGNSKIVTTSSSGALKGLAINGDGNFITADIDDDEGITISHTTLPSAPTFTSSIDGNSLTIADPVIDNAGHTTGTYTNIFTLPTTSGDNVYLSASEYDSSTNQNIISHTTYYNTAPDLSASVSDSDHTLTLKKPIVNLAGHITGTETQVLNLPQSYSSVSTSGDGSILIGVTSSDNEITLTKGQLSGAVLDSARTTNFVTGSSLDNTISPTDTLGEALEKIPAIISDKVSIPADTLTAIQELSNMDATVSQSPADSNGYLTLSATQTNGKLTGISGSIETVQANSVGVIQASIATLSLSDTFGVTATAAEINKLHDNDVTADDFTKLHSITATADEINKLHDNAVTATDFTKLHSITATADQINGHLTNTENPHGVTKSQVGLENVDNKSEATIKEDFTGSIVSNNTGFVTGGAVYTELATKASSSHTHDAGNIASGTLTVARGGTGQTSTQAALTSMLNGNQIIITSSSYGPSFPTSPTAGQLFFKTTS